MEALNYTQLASVVLVLSVASLLLFIISLILVFIIRRNHNRAASCFITQDTIIGGLQSLINKNTKDISLAHNRIERVHEDVSTLIRNEIAKLIKPKYSIGDKIVCSDGTRGTITDIEPTNGSFCYTYKTRKYFSNPAKTLKTTEYGILGLS